MRFIKAWSFGLANQLTVQMGDNHEKRRVYYFGFQVFVGALVKLIILAAASLLLGSFLPALVIAVSFATVRVQAGGYHMDTYGKCIATSVFLFLAAACTAQYTYRIWSYSSLLLLLFITMAVSLFISFRHAPADNPNRPITKKEELHKFKRLTILTLGGWGLALALLLVLKPAEYPLYILAGCFGILLEMFTITPRGYAFFHWIAK